MGIEPIKSTRIYEEIVRQIKTMISEGRLKSGDQLPPERDRLVPDVALSVAHAEQFRCDGFECLRLVVL